MSEATQNPQQQTEDQYLQEAQNFFGQSMGRIKGRMQSDSAQLESLMQQLPEESQAQVQEMTDSYSQFEGVMDQAAQDAGVQEVMDEAAQQSRQDSDEAVGQEPADQAAGQAQETIGQVGDQAQDAAGQAAGQATDQAGQVAGQAQDAVGGVTDQVGQVAGQATDQAGQVADQAQEAAGGVAENLPEGFEAVGEATTDEEGNTVQRAE
ncbi:MAG: hypothetical protein H0U65_07315, partial [Rubrobacter sp.]|nr:hypothetical protein [Rubrobacter sp.]